MKRPSRFGNTTVNTTISTIPKKITSAPKKNDETSEKLPTLGDCILSTTLFP